jgi:hypothetical protein
MLNSQHILMAEELMCERMGDYERAAAQRQLVQQAQAGQPQHARLVASYALLRCGRLLLRAGARLAEPRIA